MRSLSIWRTLLGVDKTVVEAVDLDIATVVFVASVRLTRSMRNRCGSCQKRTLATTRGRAAAGGGA